jgi:hypothetical protein
LLVLEALCFDCDVSWASIACLQAKAFFREEREHMVSHQLDRLRHRPNVATGLQAINTVRKDRSHVTAGQYFSLHQVLQQGKCGRSIGNRNALAAAAEEVNHGYLHPRLAIRTTPQRPLSSQALEAAE